MALDFSIRDFFSPIKISQLIYQFNKNQWLAKNLIESQSLKKLKNIITFSDKHIPYYQKLFSEIDFSVSKIDQKTDLLKLPILTREQLQSDPDIFLALGINRNSLSKVSTSGSSGKPLSLYMDSSANALEFAYYWRFWSQHGYSIGARFAEFSAYSFQGKSSGITHKYQKITNRLILNSLFLSETVIRNQHKLLTEYHPKFLKGSPTALMYYASQASALDLKPVSLKAIFTSGEVLTNNTRSIIENYFKCKVFDSYGHMERVVAASECEYQNLHLNLDYGFVEFEPVDVSKNIYKLIGSSLHNYAMPLIRYAVEDLVEYDPEQKPCSCGRGFPIIKHVFGRENDVVRLPDGSIVTSLYLVFDDLPEVLAGQIIQTDNKNITLRFVAKPNASQDISDLIFSKLNEYLSNHLMIKLERLETLEELIPKGRKFKVVESKIE